MDQLFTEANNLAAKSSWSKADIDRFMKIILDLYKRNSDLSLELQTFIKKSITLEERLEWYRTTTIQRVKK